MTLARQLRTSFFTFLLLVAVLAVAPSRSPAASSSDSDSTPDGAPVPFHTHEAEDAQNHTNGLIVRMKHPPARGELTPEMEASNRGYVALTGPGQYLEIPQVEVANTILIRQCIPDAPTGGGSNATLSLYVNGHKRQTLELSSFHNWVYGKKGANGQSNDPSAGPPHVFWDESRFFVAGGIKAGDTVRLQKDEGDTASFYRIDLVDLENVPAPLAQPVGSLSVVSYGASGDGKTDNAKAFISCFADARKQKKIAWIPPGAYCVSDRLAVAESTVQGAGMWYTNLISTQLGKGWGGKTGFMLVGDGTQLRDFSLDSAVHSSRNDPGGKTITAKNLTHWLVENVWISHTNVGFWMSGAQHGIIRGCRVRCTYADGINLNNGSSDNLVENCSIRGTGDDGMAILADAGNPQTSSHNTLLHNTVTAVWWGANCDLAGGDGHVIEHNYWADNACGECFTINLPGSFPMHPQVGSVIRHNTIVRGGGNLNGQKRGAAWFLADSTSIDNVVFADNRIIDSFFSGIHLTGRSPQNMTFSDNVITNPQGDGILVGSNVTGSGKFTNNTVTGLTASHVPLKNTSANYVGSQ